jgi:prepilin-type N-terminal cleavage/methylation domain-containing protein
VNARRGFTLVEVVVAAAIMAIVAAAVAPSLMGYYNARRSAETADILDSLGLALNNAVWMNGYQGFLQTVGTYPLQLHSLTTQITATDKQCSGAVFTSGAGGQTSLWRSSPPFTLLNIIAGNGVSTPLGWIRDSVIKGTTANNTAGWVELHMDSISLADAQRLDSLIDRSAVGAGTGLLRYGNSPNAGFQLVRYLIAAPLFRRKNPGGATTPVDSAVGCF